MSTNGFYEEIIVAGFGGQGIILMGKLIAQTAMAQGLEVTYMPAYGAEVRGGTSNCMVIIADELIASPLVNKPSSLIVMNKASLSKFGPRLKKDGLLVINSSQVKEAGDVDGLVKVVTIPADKIASQLGNVKVANMVALGAYLQQRGVFSPEVVAENLRYVLAERYHGMLAVNTQALRLGAEYASDL